MSLELEIQGWCWLGAWRWRRGEWFGLLGRVGSGLRLIRWWFLHSERPGRPPCLYLPYLSGRPAKRGHCWFHLLCGLRKRTLVVEDRGTRRTGYGLL